MLACVYWRHTGWVLSLCVVLFLFMLAEAKWLLVVVMGMQTSKVEVEADYFKPNKPHFDEDESYFEREVEQLELEEEEKSSSSGTTQLHLAPGERRLWIGYCTFVVVLLLALLLAGGERHTSTHVVHESNEQVHADDSDQMQLERSSNGEDEAHDSSKEAHEETASAEDLNQERNVVEQHEEVDAGHEGEELQQLKQTSGESELSSEVDKESSSEELPSHIEAVAA